MAQSINTPFQTGPGNVTLKVHIGDGQMASSVVRLQGGSPETHENSFQKDLGPGSDLAGKRLLCSTLVTDVRDETDRTSVRVVVTDGATTVDESREEVAGDVGVVTYATVVRFR